MGDGPSDQASFFPQNQPYMSTFDSQNMSQQQYLAAMVSQLSEERVSGYPKPDLYDQYYINRYAYPKGLKCAGKRSDRDDKIKRSLYDMRIP